MTEHSEDFQALARDAGLPTTEAEFNTEFDKLREDAELTITNTSAFGPFWRFVQDVATKPAKWLVDCIIETVLPQAFVKTATGVFLELHAWAVNLTRKEAVAAEGALPFTRADTAGEWVLPESVVVQSTVINGQVYSVQTVAETVFADGVATLVVPVKALDTGDAYNLGEGYYTVLAEPIDGLSVMHLADWLTVPGANQENDDALRARIRNQYTAINQWHTDAVYTALIAAFDGVSTENIYFEHDAPRGPGTANAYVLLETGNPGAAFIASIQSSITDDGNHGHGDDLLVLAMPETGHDVICTVWLTDNLSGDEQAALLADIGNFIRCVFRENTDYTVTKTRPWALLSFSELGRELHTQFNAVTNVVFNLTHIDSAMAIPRLQSLTVLPHDQA